MGKFYNKVMSSYGGVVCVIIGLALFLVKIANIYIGTEVSSSGSANEIEATPFTPEPDVDIYVNWEEIFRFIPNGISDCRNLFPEANKTIPFPAEVHETLNKLTRMLEVKQVTLTEGHSLRYTEEGMVYVRLARMPFVRTICETGFNAGHSAALWLAANPKAKVMTFDIGVHDYSRHAAQYLEELFPGRLEVIWGDSSVTLPQFINKNPDVTCDLVIIDGGHTTRTCLADFQHFRRLVSPVNVVLLDNYPDLRGEFMRSLGDCWESRKRRGEVAEVMHCSYSNQDGTPGEDGLENGFSVGRIIV